MSLPAQSSSPVRRLAVPVPVALLAAVLVVQTGFLLVSYHQQHEMTRLIRLGQHRRDACLGLKWRWEADDQEHQYQLGSSAGTRATVGPISGYVMDVTENESGHAEGYCHPVHPSYLDLAAGY